MVTDSNVLGKYWLIEGSWCCHLLQYCIGLYETVKTFKLGAFKMTSRSLNKLLLGVKYGYVVVIHRA